MNIAFYAPLKPPTWPVPSGDRLIARALMSALGGAGHRISLMSRFRSFDLTGDARRQERLARIGEKLAARLLRRIAQSAPDERPDLWFTYHLFHKAPDWIGPLVAQKMGIPYVVAEASFAPKQAGGPWAKGHEAVARALGKADMVIAFNRADMACVAPCLATPDVMTGMKPFLDCQAWRTSEARRALQRQALNERFQIEAGTPLLLSVAMMRAGDKLASYQLLAKALARLGDKSWHLLVAGDGRARSAVHEAFAPLKGRVSWLGECDSAQLAVLYAGADFFVWPAIREAIGMCFLEAQAAGLPVVGGRGGGVPDVILDGETGFLSAYGEIDDFAKAVGALLDDPVRRAKMGQAAARYAADEHDHAATGQKLGRILERFER